MAGDDGAADLRNKIGKGTTIFWKAYEFENGERKDSRFLILTDCQYGCFLAVRPTTKTEFYEKPTSSIVREFIVIPKRTERAFPAKSAIDFARIRILNWVVMEPIWGKDIKELSPATDGLLDQIDKLVSGSKIVAKASIKWIKESPRRNTK